jgi:sulfide:quinone oxidoreductase
MERIAKLSPFLSVSAQISETDVGALAAGGYRAIINNRPDNEGEGQPSSAALAAAAGRHGLDYRHLPVEPGKVTDADIAAFAKALAELRGPVLGFCRTGTRSATLWSLAEARHLDPEAIMAVTTEAGYNLEALRPRLVARWQAARPAAGGLKLVAEAPGRTYDVVIVGGGAAGISTASSLLRRRPGLSIAIIEPRDRHYYQPGWTLVGANVFDRRRTERSMASVMPRKVTWIRAAAADFEPNRNCVVLEDGERIGYRALVAAPGIKLNWQAIQGLEATLGRNGVTSNYLFDMAPYTWELVRSLRSGRALFTQPPMPIKCAGAPQKAMYLSCDHWRQQAVLKDIEVEFNLAGAVLFGVKEFVPPLMRYVERYGAQLAFNSNLKAVDGPAHKAWFDIKGEDGSVRTVEKDFDMIHVVPPQTAPDFVRQSALADAAGWVEVSPETLQHPRYGNVFGVGDACSAPNAKTAAAVRKQAPVAAENVLALLDGKELRAVYDGYGSCPLTVERGKVILAEFGYGGKLLPTFPLEPTTARRSAWLLKARILPYLYWDVMLKGREWLCAPTLLPHQPTAHDKPDALAAQGR